MIQIQSRTRVFYLLTTWPRVSSSESKFMLYVLLCDRVLIRFVGGNWWVEHWYLKKWFLRKCQIFLKFCPTSFDYLDRLLSMNWEANDKFRFSWINMNRVWLSNKDSTSTISQYSTNCFYQEWAKKIVISISKLPILSLVIKLHSLSFLSTQCCQWLKLC